MGNTRSIDDYMNRDTTTLSEKDLKQPLFKNADYFDCSIKLHE